MPKTHPDTETLRAVLALAVRAPSVHNSQPWLWRIGRETVHLYADESRRLPHTDPDGRDLLLSCGAVLHHLRVAARAEGWETTIHRLPDPAAPEHLASVEFHSTAFTAEDVELARAIGRRGTDRRRFSSWEVPAAHIEAIVAAGEATGVLVRDVDAEPARTRLLRAFEQAAWEHARDLAYGAELAQWSGRHAASQGVPARNAVLTDTDPTVRPFSNPGLPEAVVRDVDAADRMMLLSTSSDDRLSRLRAGEAASAVLLTATTLGLATCPLTEPMELTDTRKRIRSNVLDDTGYPQIVIRIGYAIPSADPVPATPRRPLDEVVQPLDPSAS
ncbi:NAD(P)H nitroreductase [Nocardia gipuzkoensis]|uniref:Acg family FMN-binding oxidoreductase n=1 Tax=Nocardia gipuzkoensis TaxID=2749991 RepID=UPI001E5FF959|nr:NAD(P)H nitroreductase [Nocardia gipuzkoensis]UGT67785.1 NAD(P)H nitroreductase [Nocardia gipuzkoensis]